MEAGTVGAARSHAGNRAQRYASVVITALSAAFIFEEIDYGSISQFTRKLAFSPKGGEESSKPTALTDDAAVVLYTSAGMASDPEAFPLDSWSMVNLTSVVTGGSSIS